MKTATKLTFAAVIAALSLSAIPSSSWADNGHWKHERRWHDRGWHDRGWHRRHFDEVLVIREPRYVYREPAYVYREPVYVYQPRRPAVVIGVDIPPLVIPF